MNALTVSEILAIARACRPPCADTIDTLVGSQIVTFARRLTAGMEPRTSPGRRADDKLDLTETCAKLIDVAHALIEELQAERKDHHTTRSALVLAEALLNRERGFAVPIPTS